MRTRKSFFSIRVLVTLIAAVSTSARAQQGSLTLPVPGFDGEYSANYFDEAYLADEGAQHLGVDLPAQEGSTIVSPVVGRVILNRTNASNAFNSFLIVRANNTGHEHVFAHIVSDLAAHTPVSVGDPLGTIVTAGSGPHLHWGINTLSVAAAIHGEWGFGRGPNNSTQSQAIARGWIDPQAFVETLSTPTVSRSNWDATVFAANPKALQTRLNDLGYDAGEVDGYPGPQTRQALMQFQAEKCLVPTGQPDARTSVALAANSAAILECAGADLPIGISANTPLKNGIYVSSPSLCKSDPSDLSVLDATQRIISDDRTTFGYHVSCKTRRTDIHDSVTLWRGTCSESLDTTESKWRFNVLTNEDFIEIEGIFENQSSNGSRFSRCDDRSVRAAAWSQ